MSYLCWSNLRNSRFRFLLAKREMREGMGRKGAKKLGVGVGGGGGRRG